MSKPEKKSFLDKMKKKAGEVADKAAKHTEEKFDKFAEGKISKGKQFMIKGAASEALLNAKERPIATAFSVVSMFTPGGWLKKGAVIVAGVVIENNKDIIKGAANDVGGSIADAAKDGVDAVKDAFNDNAPDQPAEDAEIVGPDDASIDNAEQVDIEVIKTEGPKTPKKKNKKKNNGRGNPGPK